MPLDFIKSERGKCILAQKGFLYRFESILKLGYKNTIWKFVEIKKKCKSRIGTFK